jgi:thioredoxin 1
MVEPVIESLALELDGKVKVRTLNVDQNPEAAADFHIVGVPTFIIFNKGREVRRGVGARSRQQLLRMIVDAVQGT